MWYVLDRDDEIIAVHADETSAIFGAGSIVERMVDQGEFRACVFVVTKAHFDAALRQGESPRRWHDYKTGGAPGDTPLRHVGVPLDAVAGLCRLQRFSVLSWR